MPFGTAEFLDAFVRYNTVLWPAAVALPLVGALVAALAMSRRDRSTAAAIGLALLWTWTALFYHVAFFVTVTPAAYAFAALCLAEAAALAWYGAAARTLRFDFAHDAVSGVVGLLLVAYALVGYPVVGQLAGHRYPAAPTFGLPCPTTIFTLGVLAWARRPVPWPVVAPAVAWSVIGGSAAFQLGMREDIGLPVAAVALLALLARGHLPRHHAARPG